MGALTSRQNAGSEDHDMTSVHLYKYPPKNGNYFASHFIMGGERFDAPQPEAYLFGENNDLNFLGSRPTPFPYPPPQTNEPTKTLKCRVNIRKESVRMVKVVAPSSKGDEIAKTHYNVEFMFDSDCNVSITIYYFVAEDVTPNGIVFARRDKSIVSETYNYSVGANQLFCQPSHTFDPSLYNDDDLLYNIDKEIIPVAIHCVAQETAEESKQSHTTYAVVEKHADGTYVLKALKQKIFLDGLSYLLQEIYGIENKNQETICNNKNVSDVDTEDNGAECVICMSDIRDTLILPCRHLCLCNACADSLRYQANNCPICRAPFRALLQIRALRKSGADGTSENADNVPPGYEAVSLIEALNGPCIRITGDRSDSIKSRRSCKSINSINSEELSNSNDNTVKENDITESSLLFVKRKRDSVKTVDETSQRDAHNDDIEEEVDSEAEKYSPLLSGVESSVTKSNTSLKSAGRYQPSKSTEDEEEDNSASSTDSASSKTNLQNKSGRCIDST